MQEALDVVDYARPQVAARLPEYAPAVMEMRRELGVYLALVHTSAHRGVNLLLTQTANDFCDLLADIGMGRGRPAMRSLRSVFESLITILDINSDGSEAADRYAAHYYVTMYQAATMDVGLSGLTGKDLKSERHHRRKQQRVHKQAHDDAISERGPTFKRGWADGSLLDRATRHGYAEDYDLYRVLSSSVHVSAGGARGIERRYDDISVHRFGPDLINCPMSFNEGLRYFRLFVEAVASNSGFTAERLTRALADLESLRDAYRKLILRIDSDMWPDEPPIAVVVVRALLPDGQRKWLLHDRQQQRIIECSHPQGASREQLDAVERALNEVGDTYNDRREWITAAVVGAAADPLQSSKWRPEILVLVPMGWDPHGLTLPWDQ